MPAGFFFDLIATELIIKIILQAFFFIHFLRDIILLDERVGSIKIPYPALVFR